MNVILSPQPPLFPHQHETARFSPTRCASPFHNMSGRKRKADEDGDEMSVSPLTSPAMPTRQLARPSKKVRSNDVTGRPLALPRLLETLDASQLRAVLGKICDAHPAIGHEVVTSAPKPTVESVMRVLEDYEAKLKAALPYGQSSEDYTYYRVKQPLVLLADALSEFTTQYLPPTETQASTSLQYLDGATKIIHSLPNWESQAYRHHKENAYEEISRAWALVINEAAKRRGGFSLHQGAWDQALAKHHMQSGNRLGVAMDAMAQSVGWMDNANTYPPSGDPNSIRNQLLNGTYGAPVRVGPF